MPQRPKALKAVISKTPPPPGGKLRAIIIDSVRQEVREEFLQVDSDGSSLNALQAAVGGYIEMVRCIPHADLYIDEDGIAHAHETGFMLRGFPGNPLLGNGVLVASNDDGETIDCPLSVLEVQVQLTGWLVAPPALGPSRHFTQHGPGRLEPPQHGNLH